MSTGKKNAKVKTGIISETVFEEEKEILDRNYDAYLQLAYAVDDPLCNCVYSSKKLFDVYFNGDVVSLDAYLVSSVLRNFYYDQTSYDYDMQRLFDSISENEAFQDLPLLKSVIRDMMDFKKDNSHGARYYAHSLIQSTSSSEDDIDTICAEAKTIYQNITSEIKQNTNSKFLLETKKMIFSKAGDLAQNLLLVAENQYEYHQLLTDYLRENFYKDNADLNDEGIDNDKLFAFVETYWDRANIELDGKQKKKLPAAFFNSIRITVLKVISVIRRYVCYHQAAPVSDKDTGFINFKKAKNGAIEKLETCYKDIISGVKAHDLHGTYYVISDTLEQIIDELNGINTSFSKRYFYVPFLQNDYVLLDNQYLPQLENIEGLPEMAAEKRILKHSNSKLNTFEEQLQKIFDGEDDYGSAKLIIDYLRDTQKEDFDYDAADTKRCNGIKHPEDDINNRLHQFEEELELSQMYGQLETSKHGWTLQKNTGRNSRRVSKVCGLYLKCADMRT